MVCVRFCAPLFFSFSIPPRGTVNRGFAVNDFYIKIHVYVLNGLI